MKKLITLILICIGLASQAQTNGGIMVVGGVAVNVPDTSTYKYVQAVYNGGDTLSLTHKFAANFLVTNEKVLGLWSKSVAEYPILGSTAGSHKWNIKDPRNVDAAYRLNFIGSWTHSYLGAKPNNINQTSGNVANTFFTPTTIEANHAVTFYTNENITSGWSIMVDIIAQNTSPDKISIDISAFRQDFNNGLFVSGNYNTNPSVILPIYTNNSKGVIIGNRSSLSSQKVWKNGILINSNNSTISSFTNTKPFYLAGGYLTDTSFTSCSPRINQYSCISTSYTDLEALYKSVIVISFESILGR